MFINAHLYSDSLYWKMYFMDHCKYVLSPFYYSKVGWASTCLNLALQDNDLI